MTICNILEDGPVGPKHDTELYFCWFSYWLYSVTGRRLWYKILTLLGQWEEIYLTAVQREVQILSLTSTLRNIMKNKVLNTRWFKYDRDKLWLVYTQIVPVIFEPPCTNQTTNGLTQHIIQTSLSRPKINTSQNLYFDPEVLDGKF